jgi:hypothetical protein
MQGVEPGWRVPPELRGESLPEAYLERLEIFAAGLGR